jgi:Uma2 family endonuclease
METRVVLPEEALPAKLELNPDWRMSDDDYFGFCMANPDVRFERTEEGEIVIVPPAGLESNYRENDAATQLRNWAKRDGRGKAFGATAEFILPTGAALSPDAAWVSNERLSRVPKPKLRQFPPLCPEFIIEVMSPSDRLPTAQKKMESWMRGGVDLAWLIDGDNRKLYIYRVGSAGPETRADIPELAAGAPIEGFILDLREIWAGL